MNLNQIQTCTELFGNCPTSAALFDTKTLKLYYANPSMLRLWGRDSTVIGLSLLDFLPEVECQGYPDLLKIVGQSDTPYSELGAEVKIMKNETLQSVYVDYSYTPIKAGNRIPSGILVTATELSEKHINMLSGEEYQRNLRALVLAAPVPMCIYRGRQLKIEVINSHMLDLWQCDESRNIRIINHVFHTGHPLEYTEYGITYSCTALRNEQGQSVGCVLIALNNRCYSLKAHLS
jgi:hypothetical protein